MKATTTLLIALVGLTANLAVAQQANAPEANKIQLTKSEESKASTGSADYFIGDVTVDSGFASEYPDTYRGAIVTFQPGARTAWHYHPRGQTLVIIAGVGRVQSDGEAVLTVKPGDTVWIPANERHWHGAAPDQAMSHVAIVEPVDNKSTTWQEQVSDEIYNTTPEN